MMSEFDMPFVYDDHEYWPLQARLLKEIADKHALDNLEAGQSFFDLPKNIRRKFINNYAVKLWTKWESEVVSSYPTITVSSKIAEEMKTNAETKQVALHNYSPMRSCLALTQEEMDTIEKNIQTLTEKAFLNYLITMI